MRLSAEGGDACSTGESHSNETCSISVLENSTVTLVINVYEDVQDLIVVCEWEAYPHLEVNQPMEIVLDRVEEGDFDEAEIVLFLNTTTMKENTNSRLIACSAIAHTINSTNDTDSFHYLDLMVEDADMTSDGFSSVHCYTYSNWDPQDVCLVTVPPTTKGLILTVNGTIDSTATVECHAETLILDIPTNPIDLAAYRDILWDFDVNNTEPLLLECTVEFESSNSTNTTKVLDDVILSMLYQDEEDPDSLQGLWYGCPDLGGVNLTTKMCYWYAMKPSATAVIRVRANSGTPETGLVVTCTANNIDVLPLDTPSEPIDIEIDDWKLLFVELPDTRDDSSAMASINCSLTGDKSALNDASIDAYFYDTADVWEDGDFCCGFHSDMDQRWFVVEEDDLASRNTTHLILKIIPLLQPIKNVGVTCAVATATVNGELEDETTATERRHDNPY